MPEKILIISTDTAFIEQVKSFKSDDYELVIENTAPNVDEIDSEIILCLADVSTVEIPDTFFSNFGKRRVFISTVAILENADEDLIESYARLAGEVWLKSFPPIILEKMLSKSINIKALDTAKRDQSEQMAIFAHEIKNPLTSIKGYTSALLYGFGENLPDEQKTFLRIIKENADQIDMLLQKINFVPDMSTTPMRLTLERTEVIKVIAEVRKVYKNTRRLAEEDDYWDINLDDKLPDVMADFSRTVQILTNLVLLSLKSNSHNEKVVVRGIAVGDFVRLSVLNIYIDIPNDDLERFIDDNNYSGAKNDYLIRLGLKGTKAWVEKHGGKIWVESEFGKGSTVHFTLPIYNPAVHQAEAQVSPDASGEI